MVARRGHGFWEVRVLFQNPFEHMLTNLFQGGKGKTNCSITLSGFPSVPSSIFPYHSSLDRQYPAVFDGNDVSLVPADSMHPRELQLSPRTGVKA